MYTFVMRFSYALMSFNKILTYAELQRYFSGVLYVSYYLLRIFPLFKNNFAKLALTYLFDIVLVQLTNF